MAQGPAVATGMGFMSPADDSDDLPRTFRREREARAREARERAEKERAAAPALPDGAEPQPQPMPAPQVYAAADVQPNIQEMPYPASVRRFDVPFGHLVTFFLKAVIAAIPALILLTVVMWLMGSALQYLFPELVKMRIIFAFPNG